GLEQAAAAEGVLAHRPECSFDPLCEGRLEMVRFGLNVLFTTDRFQLADKALDKQLAGRVVRQATKLMHSEATRFMTFPQLVGDRGQAKIIRQRTGVEAQVLGELRQREPVLRVSL